MPRRALDAIFALQPFLLGDLPTLSDFGFFASMFRHLGLDPTPGAIMLERAPHVFAWLGRVWAARDSRIAGTLASGIPGAWSPILREVGEAYLPYLCAERRGAEGPCAAPRRHDPGHPPLEEPRRHFDALTGEARTGATERLEGHGCWEPLWCIAAPTSGYDREGAAPFARGLPVFFC